MDKEFDFLQEKLNENAQDEINTWRNQYKKNEVLLSLKDNPAIKDLLKILNDKITSINHRLLNDEQLGETERLSLFQSKKAYLVLTSFFDFENAVKANQKIESEVEANIKALKQ